LPHSARAISQLGKTVPKSELQPGDLVFFNTLKSAFSHVGILPWQQPLYTLS